MRAFTFRDPAYVRMVQGGGGGGGGGGGSYPAGAVAAWHFDNASSASSDPVTDATGNGNDLTVFHGTTTRYTTPKLGTKSLRVLWTDSNLSYFRLLGTDTDLQAAAAFSITTWFKTLTNGLFATHCPSGDEPVDGTFHYLFGQVNASGYKLRAALNAGADVLEIAGDNSNAWTFAAMVFDGTNLKLSKNGAAFSEMTPSVAPTIASGDFWVGGGEGTEMNIDEMVKWNSALTIEQVQYLYNSGNGRAYA